MKRILFAITILIAMSSSAQTDWNKIQRLIDEGSYKTAYEQAERVLTAASSAERLRAAWFMSKAASMYQEDAFDSAVSRYRALLPNLDPLEQALCHAFLGEYEQALHDEPVLKQTAVERVKDYAGGAGTVNVTPTVYDMVVVMMQDRGELTPQQRLDWQRRLVEFHSSDSDDIRIWHDLRQYHFDRQVPNRALQCGSLHEYMAKYRDTKSPYFTQFYSLLAEECNSKGDFVQAVRYCDTAVLLAPRSEGGVRCANLREDIKRVRLSLDGQCLTLAPGRQSLHRLSYRNAKKVWLRVVPYVDRFEYDDKVKAKLLSAKPLEQWDMDLPLGDEYREEHALFAVPALKAGRYVLLLSPQADFKEKGFVAYELHCTDMQLIQNGHEGFLLDRTTGHPIAGQPLRLERGGKVVAQATTDADGRYRLNSNEERWGMQLVIERGGYVMQTPFYREGVSTSPTGHAEVQVRTDRPIYKPGEEVQAALLCYTTDGLDASVATGRTLHLQWLDPNWQEVRCDTVLTDEYGVASSRFTIPTDRIAGQYRLVVRLEEKEVAAQYIRVEEYKQPKFMVTMETGQAAPPRFGQPCTVRGLAASYSAVPVSGARVHYIIERNRLNRWWWRWWGYEAGIEVAEGELTTAADGSFEVTFIPEPDSSIDLSHKPAFEYTVRVDVTDLNGESHPAQVSMRVGFQTAFLALEGGEEVTTLDNLKVKHFDLNGNPLQGKVDIKIERLRQPSVPLLDPKGMMPTDHLLLSEADFSLAFPLYAYSAEYNNRSCWQVASQGWKGEGGIYRITLSSQDADTAVEYRSVTPIGARKAYSQRLLWVEESKRSVEVGETFVLRFGSRFKEVDAYCLLRVGNGERVFKRFSLNDEIKEIAIPIDSTMLGGFQVDLFAVREGLVEHTSHRVDVPFSHKKLEVDIATFRDKLLPGEQEEWTISVTSGEWGVGSAMVMTMYDDALNSYNHQAWTFAPWRRNVTRGLSLLNLGSKTGWWLVEPRQVHYRGSQPTVWHLMEALPHYGRWGRGRIMYKTAARAASNMALSAVATVEDNAEMEMFVEEESVMMDADQPMAMGAAMESDESGAAGAEPVQVRTNLNTLAFFAADVRTDADGRATYRFTVPELLTRWNVRGLAFTKDIRIGTLERTVVTQKPLMVQPNLPRFLRHGDSLSLLAKVMRTEPGHPLDVTVTFLLTDAATGDTLCYHREHVQVSDAAQVMFPVEVPRDVYVATYRIVAEADGMSDGEQGQLPVVASRQTVTVSKALYINGKGEKTFSFPLSSYQSPTAEPHLLAAEVVSNPMWLAVKAMPYLKELENPSNLYLANSMYINSLGMKVLDYLDILDDFESLEEGQDVRMKMNEDVKQTLLQATPWVRDALGEEEQRKAMAAYFDKGRIANELADAASQLARRQNGDGGWSWMPEGESSVWITQQILKKLSAQDKGVSEVKNNALKYVDREEQRYYDRWIKPHLKKGYDFQPTHIDYLYTRSFYGQGSTEAYKYYYSNALKRYKEFEHLYTQAQLALIFHRAGDKKQARDLIRRLKEKTLTSDEMGTYWRDNRSSWCWYERPIETQALLIQAFSEVTPQDTLFIGQMQQWLLKQKQTTHWGNDEATVKAIDALMINYKQQSVLQPTMLTVCGTEMTAGSKGREGYREQRWRGEELHSLLSHASEEVSIQKKSSGIAWGGVYYQFTDDMDRIPSSESGITLTRSYTKVGSGPLKVGDRVKVRVDISCDRTMEYLELVDGRPSCTEPLSTEAGWRWNDGLRYYITVNNTDTRCYIDRLEKGKYWFEYEVYVTNPGTFLSGPVTMQCMYAPEFRAVSPAERMVVE